MSWLLKFRPRPTRFCALCILSLAIPLLLTYMAWNTSVHNIYRQNLSDFEKQAIESEKSLLHLIESYNAALMGGVGLFNTVGAVRRDEWRTFVDSLNIPQSLPGVSGIGYIERVNENDIPLYLKSVRADGMPDFSPHPETGKPPHYVITYIEPVANNRRAVGLDISFETNRKEAADLSMTTGQPAITKKISLIQDQKKTPGFLLLHPLYKSGMATDTPEKRTLALRGWIFAPFIANDFLNEITSNQGKIYNIRIYDGTDEQDDLLIYASSPASSFTPAFSVRKEVEVMQRTWLIVWESTPEFEKTLYRYGPLIILICGVICSFLLSIIIIILIARQEKAQDWIANTDTSMLPIMIFVAMAATAYFVHNALKSRENAVLRATIEQEAENLQQRIVANAQETFLAVARMGNRWEESLGTDENLWRADAHNYVKDISGLRAMQWIDPTYHIRWVEPVSGNKNVLNMNILFNEERRAALDGAAERDSITITPPLSLVQGYTGFIVYTPLKIRNEFSGFISGVFDANAYMASNISARIIDDFLISIAHDSSTFFISKPRASNILYQDNLAARRKINVEDTAWDITLTPTQSYVRANRSILPEAILFFGMLVAALLAITIRSILVSQAQTIKLRQSEETLRSAIDSSSIGMALVSLDGSWLKVNRALCDIIGYTQEELLATNFQKITYPDDLESDLEKLRMLVRGEIESYSIDKRYYHKNGNIVWARLSVSLAQHSDGKPHYFVSQIQDITEQREIENLKNDFISIVSHELRTPVTSIRGSLGLIQGTMFTAIPEKAQNLISIAYKNCERLILLINDLLDLDKLIAGQMEFVMAPHSLSSLITDGIANNSPYASEFNVTILSDAIPENLTVHVDPLRWQQVFSNLLSNAAKFSPEGETIRITTEVKGNDVEVSIIDKGPGIPPEFQKRIFTKFAQSTDTAGRRAGGTGLGLNISREIILRMGGSIGFNTATGQGTTFWFTLPLFNGHTPA